MAENKTNR